MTNATSTDRRRAEIVAIAAKLFAQNGYIRTSMSAIAEAAGISKPTLYYYFPSKDAILVMIHHQYIHPLLERHRSMLSSGASVPEMLSTVVHDIMGVVESRRDEVTVFSQAFKDLPVELQAAARVDRDAYQDLIEEMIARGIAEGDLKPQVDIAVTALAFLGLINGAYQWYRSDGRLSHDEIADVFTDILLDGLLRPPRRGSDPLASPDARATGSPRPPVL